MSKIILLNPRISEKAYGMAEAKNVYVFEVPTGSPKLEIAKAVNAQFDVTVTAVNTMNVKGKVKRTVKRGGRAVAGSRSNFKKAYITLKDGDSIPVFASEDDNEAKKPADTKKGKK